jgi:GNAT superfamily N-acetyltransferase
MRGLRQARPGPRHFRARVLSRIFSCVLHASVFTVTDKIIIRVVQERDFAQWKVLWDGYNAFYGRMEASALPDAITNMTWSRFLDAYEPVHALVAERTGQLLGLTHFLFHRSTITIAPTCYLQDLFTSETARGKGVGRALIEEVYRRAQQAGAGRVYWQTHESNAIAMKLYDKLAEKSGFLVYRKAL